MCAFGVVCPCLITTSCVRWWWLPQLIFMCVACVVARLLQPLCDLVVRGATSLGATVTDKGLVTTPQLHHIVRITNAGVGTWASEEGYYAMLAEGSRGMMQVCVCVVGCVCVCVCLCVCMCVCMCVCVRIMYPCAMTCLCPCRYLVMRVCACVTVYFVRHGRGGEIAS
jgi:hypothetical protein